MSPLKNHCATELWNGPLKYIINCTLNDDFVYRAAQELHNWQHQINDVYFPWEAEKKVLFLITVPLREGG